MVNTWVRAWNAQHWLLRFLFRTVIVVPTFALLVGVASHFDSTLRVFNFVDQFLGNTCNSFLPVDVVRWFECSWFSPIREQCKAI